MSEQNNIYIQRRMFRDVQGALLNQHEHMKDGRIHEEPVLPFAVQPITLSTLQRLIVEDLADAYTFSYETEHSMTAPSATGTAR